MEPNLISGCMKKTLLSRRPSTLGPAGTVGIKIGPT
uniref:Uncharacterized protein n=1 Tax=Steinernema glaseri TaxID=37863 RepID=A0A1I7YUC2_9BILA